ncbi:MAG TPA: phage holin family protein [Gaiellaceae bacterium]|jgi:membrane-bound ClpP family serine protease|nr:phage holin family protein [Gaiellaceae bacterium]
MHTPPTERSANGGLGAATKTVAEHASSLARLEVQLAALELKKKAVALGLGAGLLAGAALFGLFLLAFALAAAGAAWTLILPIWAAMLVMAGALALVAGLLALLGLVAVRKGSPPVPERAIEEARLTTEALRAE